MIRENANKKMNSKIMIWGWFGFENLGDDLLLNAMLDNLDANKRLITVPIQKKYDIYCDNLNQVKRNYNQLFIGAFKNDVLVVGPGGLFPFDNTWKVLLYFIFTVFWKMLGRKVVYFGVGISDRFNFISKKLWNNIISVSDLFITRSPYFIGKLGLKETVNVHTMSDLIFASDFIFDNGYKKTGGVTKVGIFVANLMQRGEEREYKNTLATWYEIISGLLNRGMDVDLIAFTKGSDDQLVLDIAGLFDSQAKVHTILYQDTFKIIGELKSYQFTISMRFHALVLSLLADVPTIPIAYGEKTYLLAQAVGLSEYVLVWNNFQKEYYGQLKSISANDLFEKVDLLLENDAKIRTNIALEVNDLKISARNAMKQLLDIID